MNKITSETFSLSRGNFNRLAKYMFDDHETIEGGHFKHSEYFCQLVANVDLDWASDIVERLNLQVDPSVLVGDWMVDGTTSPDNGFYWDYVSEIVKVEKVTKTVIVTEWKPIRNETAQPCSNQQPQSKVCVPAK